MAKVATTTNDWLREEALLSYFSEFYLEARTSAESIVKKERLGGEGMITLHTIFKKFIKI